MVYSEKSETISVLTGAAVTFGTFVVVGVGKLGAHNTVDGGRCDGVCYQTQADVNDSFAMAIPNGGVVQMIASGAIADGAFIASDATGLAKTAAAGNHIYGKALAAAGGAGERIPVHFFYHGTA